MSCEITVTTIEAKQWNALIEQAPDMALQQLFEYGLAKEKSGKSTVIRHLFHQDGRVVGVAQATIRKLPFSRKGLVWISRGPLILDQGADRIALMCDMLAALKQYWVDERKMYLRVLPSILSTEASKEIFDRQGYEISPNSAWASIRLNLRQDETELFHGLRKRWRRYFHRIDENQVSVTFSSTESEVEALLADYQKLMQAKSFEADAVTVDFIRRLQQALPSENKMLVFVARQGEQVLGRLLVARYGHTAMAYIIGLNAAGQEWHINHYLYWEAIKQMKRLNYQWFDLGGAHPQNTPPGILHFKQGFNGEFYQLMNEIEAVPPGLIYGLLKKIIANKR